MKEIQEEEEKRKKAATKETSAMAAARRAHPESMNKVVLSFYLISYRFTVHLIRPYLPFQWLVVPGRPWVTAGRTLLLLLDRP
jgi:hypothetical protein